MNPQPLGCCVVCGVAVYGALDGVLFGAFGKPLFTACHAHAPLLKSGLVHGAEFTKRSAGALLARKFPILAKLVGEFIAERNRISE
jgi:hypothetical protein